MGELLVEGMLVRRERGWLGWGLTPPPPTEANKNVMSLTDVKPKGKHNIYSKLRETSHYSWLCVRGRIQGRVLRQRISSVGVYPMVCLENGEGVQPGGQGVIWGLELKKKKWVSCKHVYITKGLFRGGRLRLNTPQSWVSRIQCRILLCNVLRLREYFIRMHCRGPSVACLLWTPKALLTGCGLLVTSYVVCKAVEFYWCILYVYKGTELCTSRESVCFMLTPWAVRYNPRALRYDLWVWWPSYSCPRVVPPSSRVFFPTEVHCYPINPWQTWI